MGVVCSTHMLLPYGSLELFLVGKCIGGGGGVPGVCSNPPISEGQDPLMGVWSPLVESAKSGQPPPPPFAGPHLLFSEHTPPPPPLPPFTELAKSLKWLREFCFFFESSMICDSACVQHTCTS